jgi:hypothetical protein
MILLHPPAAPSPFPKCMKAFIVHVSDPTGFDEQTTVTVDDVAQLGKLVKAALDEIMTHHIDPLAFPVFIDVHPARNYSPHAWMYQKSAGKAVATPHPRHN